MPNNRSPFRVIIRADASGLIGSGHVMRCLSLANEISARGAQITFACASIPAPLAERIQDCGHELVMIERVGDLGCEAGWEMKCYTSEDQMRDVNSMLASTRIKPEDWFILDHYNLDHRWEALIRKRGARLLVIDDLANRKHECELLLDQTWGRTSQDYQFLVTPQTRLLMGSRYALLGRDFGAARTSTLARRARSEPVRRLLISLGSGDPAGMVAQILPLATDAGLGCNIDIALGEAARSLPFVEDAARRNPTIRVHIDTRDMPALVANADLAIGAAGSSALERCCLGLPTITMILAENQREFGRSLHQAGALSLAENLAAVPYRLRHLADHAEARLEMSVVAAAITDGQGAKLVATELLDWGGKYGDCDKG